MGLGGVAVPKPRKGSSGLNRRRRRRQTAANTTTIRDYVFEREQQACRVTGWRADSMHELRSAGATGSRLKATTPENSIAVQGDGVNGVHGLLQRYEIAWEGNAESVLIFTVWSRAAATLLARKIGDQIVSIARGMPIASYGRSDCPTCKEPGWLLVPIRWPGGYNQAIVCLTCGPLAGEKSTKEIV